LIGPPKLWRQIDEAAARAAGRDLPLHVDTIGRDRRGAPGASEVE